MNNKIYFRYYLLLPFAIIWISICSCSGSKHESSENTEQDSIARDSTLKAKRNDFLSKSLHAINFENFENLEYSIDFDTVLNKTVFLTDYEIFDIKKSNNHFFLIVDNFLHSQIRLEIDSSQLNILRLAKYKDRAVLVFKITKVRKLDFKVGARIDDDSDKSDDGNQNEEKTASIEINSENYRSFFIVNGTLMKIEK